MKLLPTLILAASSILAATAFAQTPDPIEVEDGKPVELYRLTFNEAKNAFVDPATQEPFTGPIIVTYPGGRPETVGQIKDGLEDGYWIEYYEDGTKTSEGSYEAGNEVGQWYYYWENGKIESEGVYNDGMMDGTWTDYFESGKVSTSGAYADSKAEGPWKITDEDTGEVIIVQYQDGKEIAPPDATPTPTPTP